MRCRARAQPSAEPERGGCPATDDSYSKLPGNGAALCNTDRPESDRQTGREESPGKTRHDDAAIAHNWRIVTPLQTLLHLLLFFALHVHLLRLQGNYALDDETDSIVRALGAGGSAHAGSVG